MGERDEVAWEDKMRFICGLRSEKCDLKKPDPMEGKEMEKVRSGKFVFCFRRKVEH